MHKETQIAARRTYQYYSKIKGDWDGPSPRQFSKMKKSKFLDLLKRREEIEREILLTFLTLNQDHVIEDHANRRYMIKNTYMKKDYIDRQHVTWNFNTEDHVVGIFERSPRSRDGRSCGNGTYDLSRKYGSTRRHVSATVWGSGAHDGNRGALG